MAYKIFWADDKARKTFDRLPPMVQPRVMQAIEKLVTNAYPAGSKKLIGKLKGAWRIRIGDYRLIYDIDEKAKKIILLDLGHRRNIYR